jgi:Nif11 domain
LTLPARLPGRTSSRFYLAGYWLIDPQARVLEALALRDRAREEIGVCGETGHACRPQPIQCRVIPITESFNWFWRLHAIAHLARLAAFGDMEKRGPAMKRAKRSARSKPLQFLGKAQKDRKLSDRVLAAVERGGKVTAEEVMQIAKEFGFKFTRKQFEREVLRDMAARFSAGDESLADVVAAAKPKRKPPESSCAKGCLSYTKSWHPRAF